MNHTKLHSKADAKGIVHLHLDVPVGLPNSEVDIELAVTRVEAPGSSSLGPLDRRFFASVLGDRIRARRLETEERE
jgi:hypothetical protein